MLFARYDVNLLLVAVTALSAALAFVAALHLYARCYLRPRRSDSFFPDTLVEYPPDEFAYALYQVPAGGASTSGLDAKALRALPVCRWESNKQVGEPVRCAVCLGHMADGDLGRMLPACRHVFHVHCIDKWFAWSTTCPICRTTVDAPSSVEIVQPRGAE